MNVFALNNKIFNHFIFYINNLIHGLYVCNLIFVYFDDCKK